MSNVKTPRPEYNDMVDTWVKIDDCIAGETAVKNKTTTYLPKLNPADLSESNKQRYLPYLERAIFYGVCGRTLDGLKGMLFAERPTYELGAIDYLADDVDGTGLDLEQQVKRVGLSVLAKGRHGLLVDFPKTDRAVTRRDVENGVRATIQEYKPSTILNWRTQKVGVTRRLSLVVLAEDYDAGTNLFTVQVKQQYRVLRLDDDGNYVQEVYRDGQVVESHYPRLGNGQMLDYIPFYFVGSENNDEQVDRPPFETLATLNVGHYRNSADYEEALHILQPTLFIYSDMGTEQFKEANPNGIQLGSRTGHVLGQGDRAEVLEIRETSAHAKAMQDKEQQMIRAGAKLVEPNGAAKTAFQARTESASETSLLANIAGNVSDAYTKALQACAAFMNVNPEPIYLQISDDFGINELTVEERAQLVAEWQAGVIPKRIVRETLREAGVIDAGDDRNTDEALDEEVAQEGGGLNLDG